MARPKSAHVLGVKAKLVARLRDGLLRPGDRFLSNRAVAAKFNVSYQTAHRLVNELVADGLLVRRSASGTYVPGRRPQREEAQLLFHVRARRPGSFGARLLAELTTRLDRERINADVRFVEPGGPAPRVPRGRFEVIWECPAALAACVRQRRSVLLLNDRPPAGLDAVFVDSVSTDDYSGGAAAAQLLLRRGGGPFAVLSGPADDARSKARVAGFLSVAAAEVTAAAGWYFEDGLRVAGRALGAGASGIFCCNDRLAEAVVEECRRTQRRRPPLVGFDDAPVAERLGLTTIAIPWSEMAAAAVGVIRRRIAGDDSTGSQQVFAPRAVVREM